MSSGHLYVRLHSWALAHPQLRQDVWNEIMRVAGVASIDDLEVISPSTLTELMLPDEQSLVTRPKRRKAKEDT